MTFKSRQWLQENFIVPSTALTCRACGEKVLNTLGDARLHKKECTSAPLPVCGPCLSGDHRSHNPEEPFKKDPHGFWIDLYDCKNDVPPSSQCCCRATAPKEMLG